ncbi:MAG: hypothetical protein QM778_34745 [Myxococcales bacterium]
MRHSIFAALVVFLAFSSRASAQSAPEVGLQPAKGRVFPVDGNTAPKPRPSFDAAASARHGMMLPDLIAPGSDEAPRVTATGWSGYDSARESAVVRSFVDANVWARLSLRAGVSYLPDPTARSAQPMIGAKVQLLRQAKQGIDLSLGGFYRLDRFTSEEGLAQLVVSLGGRIGKLGLWGNLTYGQDLEGDDFEGESMFAVLYALRPDLQLGLEARARFLLESTDAKRKDTPAPTGDMSIAPTFSYALGPVALLAQAGASTLHTNSWHAGAIAMGGLSAVF